MKTLRLITPAGFRVSLLSSWPPPPPSLRSFFSAIAADYQKNVSLTTY